VCRMEADEAGSSGNQDLHGPRDCTPAPSSLAKIAGASSIFTYFRV
jgi:hypothetical protein